MKKYLRRIIFVLCSLFAVLLMSCSDLSKAEQLSGSWEVTVDIGDNEVQTQILTFKYDDTSFDEDGTFDLKIEGEVSNIELDEIDNSFMNISYHSTISGKYEVVAGDLYLHYDLNTLKVEVSDKDIEFDINDREALVGMKYLGMSENSIKKETALETEEAITKEFREHYSSELTSNTSYKDLMIEGSQMSFITEDYGRLVYEKK